jgi:hypothetical protein
MKLDLNKLKKMKMPESKKAMHEEDSPELAAAEEEMGMDLDRDQEEGEPEEHRMKVLGGKESGSLEDEEAMESREHEAMESPEEEAAEHEALDLTALSDEEILAEIKKRGLMAKMKAK